ncbi:MAG: hypothetical protein LBU36_04080 [Clostridiales bacterium]|jgi:serine protease inhibitor|nr:hypothetical protein [Clostridiales bacterium]
MKKLPGIVALTLAVALCACGAKETLAPARAPGQTARAEPSAAASVNYFDLLTLDDTPNKMVSPASISQAVGLLVLGFGEKPEKPPEELENPGAAETKFFTQTDDPDILRYIADFGGAADVNPPVLALYNYKRRQLELKAAYAADNQPAAGVELSFSNALWLADNDLKPLSYYKNDAKRCFDAEIRSARRADFSDTVNNWTSDKTHGKIQNVVPPDIAQNPDFKALIENVVYFKGKWLTPFKASETNMPFTNDDGAVKETPAMSLTARLPYVKTDGFEMTALKYAGSGNLYMLVILPEENAPAPAWREAESAALKILAPEASADYLKRVNLEMPKFRTEYEVSDALKNYLKPYNLFGREVPFMFEKGGAFEASDIVHKTYIDVDEGGTEAAAATAITMNKAVAAEPDDLVIMRVNRPFYYVILDPALRDGGPVFIGKQARFEN